MAYLERGLLYKHEELSSDPQTHGKVGTAPHIRDPSVLMFRWEVENPWKLTG